MHKTKKMLEIERKIGEPIEEFLRREYEENRKSTLKIGKILGVNPENILRWLKYSGIKIRDISERAFAQYGKKVERPSDEQLRKWYVKDKKSQKSIAKDLGISIRTVKKWLMRAGIKLRDLSEAQFAFHHKKIIKPTPEQLKKWYHDQNESTYEIAKIVGVSQGAIFSWMKEAGIKRRKWHDARGFDFERPSNELLQKLYVEERKSSNEIGDMVGVSGKTIREWLKEAKISRRDQRKAKFAQYGYDFEKPSNNQLRKWYLDERKSTTEICELVGVNVGTIWRWLIDGGISIRGPREAKFAALGKEIEKPSGAQLITLYVEGKKSTNEIAGMFGVSGNTIAKWLKRAGVELRDLDQRVYAKYGKQVIKPSNQQLRRWYIDEKKSSYEIADIVGVYQRTVMNWLEKAGIETRKSLYGYDEWLQCEDGHEVRSGYERRVDNWLYFNGIQHNYDVELLGGRKFRCDFKVEDNYIEIWGLIGKDFYDNKTSAKIRYYEKHGFKRIDISPDDFGSGNSFIRKLEPLLKYSDPKLRRQRQIEEFDIT